MLCLFSSKKSDYFHQGKKVCLKVDPKKAFNSVNRNFIYYTMQEMGFPPKWIFWIQSCLKILKFSIPFNGSPIGFFSSSNSIRQSWEHKFSSFYFFSFIFVHSFFILIYFMRRRVSHEVTTYSDSKYRGSLESLMCVV